MSTRHSDKELIMARKYIPKELVAFGKEVLVHAGMPGDRAETIANILVEGDLLGHNTHGLKLLPAYVKEIQANRMPLSGEPTIISDTGSAILMDGNYLPGPWLVSQALDHCFSRLKNQATVTVVIKRSHHIASLGSYLKRITDHGFVGIILSSDPNHASVAPFGSYVPRYSPNPIAAGIPTNGDPILIDMSVSSTANGVVAKYLEEGKLLPNVWLLNNKGEATNDPKQFFTNPSGSILPLGGQDLGYKGFGLGVLIEALTSALGGYGRADKPTQWGGAVYIQVINPEAFSGLDSFKKETTFFADSCRSSDPIPQGKGVVMPGYYELRSWERQFVEGVQLSDLIVESLQNVAVQFGVGLPTEIA
ncbi:MAG: lactate dehydrogenase [Spirochaetae bacterium HGW-Spirochaetae-8]|nr:MAG: lactate dehydrogenase [Spirochaetae bacterium HGW-Spirochaetae-8]